MNEYGVGFEAEVLAPKCALAPKEGGDDPSATVVTHLRVKVGNRAPEVAVAEEVCRPPDVAEIRSVHRGKGAPFKK